MDFVLSFCFPFTTFFIHLGFGYPRILIPSAPPYKTNSSISKTFCVYLHTTKQSIKKWFVQAYEVSFRYHFLKTKDFGYKNKNKLFLGNFFPPK